MQQVKRNHFKPFRAVNLVLFDVHKKDDEFYEKSSIENSVLPDWIFLVSIFSSFGFFLKELSLWWSDNKETFNERGFRRRNH